jgi:hypothetical protein
MKEQPIKGQDLQLTAGFFFYWKNKQANNHSVSVGLLVLNVNLSNFWLLNQTNCYKPN